MHNKSKRIPVPPKLLTSWNDFYAALQAASEPFVRAAIGFLIDYLHSLKGAQEALDAALKSHPAKEVHAQFVLTGGVPFIELNWKD